MKRRLWLLLGAGLGALLVGLGIGAATTRRLFSRLPASLATQSWGNATSFGAAVPR